jgi:hypothetical protein
MNYSQVLKKYGYTKVQEPPLKDPKRFLQDVIQSQNQLLGGLRAPGDPFLRDMADIIDRTVASLSALANKAPDKWDLGSWTLDADAKPVGGPSPSTKVDQGDDGLDFFTKFVYGGRRPEEMMLKGVRSVTDLDS